MASTLNVQAVINWCQPFIGYQPLAINSNEPALTSANMVMQTMLGPPFCWRWNRSSVGFVCVADGTQDYQVGVADFGFMEKATLQNPTSLAYFEIPTIATSLSRTDEKARPQFIATQADDLLGNITFRLQAAPDVAYNGTVIYQKKARLLQSLADSFSPIPDEHSYIFDWGFLGIMAVLMKDARAGFFNQKFVGHLLGAAEGLTEMQKNLFLGNWLDVIKQIERGQLGVKRDQQARGV